MTFSRASFFCRKPCLVGSMPRMMLSSTEKHSTSLKCWCTMPMPRALASLGSLDGNDLTVFLDDALLRLVHTEQDGHQGRFACAVFAQQRVDLSVPELQGNVVVGDDPREAFCNIQHLNSILRFQVESPSFRFHGPRAKDRGDRKPLLRYSIL